MKDIKKVLENLDKANMHVHVNPHRDLSGHSGMLPMDTHYVMQGDKIVHIGNKETIANFAMRLG